MQKSLVGVSAKVCVRLYIFSTGATLQQVESLLRSRIGGVGRSVWSTKPASLDEIASAKL